MHINFNHFC